MAVYNEPKLFLSSIILVLILYLGVIDCCSGGSFDETTTKSPDSDGKYFWLFDGLSIMNFNAEIKCYFTCSKCDHLFSNQPRAHQCQASKHYLRRRLRQ